MVRQHSDNVGAG
jgi:hypothetical protein